MPRKSHRRKRHKPLQIEQTKPVLRIVDAPQMTRGESLRHYRAYNPSIGRLRAWADGRPKEA